MSRSCFLTLVEGSSDKFYHIALSGKDVTIRYGRNGTKGQESVTTFPNAAAAAAVYAKTELSKRKKGYTDGVPADSGGGGGGGGGGASRAGAKRALEEDEVPDEAIVEAPSAKRGKAAPAAAAPAPPPAPDAPPPFPTLCLAIGEVREVKGSSAVPYKVKRVDDIIVTCTCTGFSQWIQRKGLEHNSCKHIREVLGDAAEAARLAHNKGGDEEGGGGSGGGGGGKKAGKGGGKGAGAGAGGDEDGDGAAAGAAAVAKKGAIVKRIALAATWTPKATVDGMLMSEKLDGMRALWDGSSLYSRAGNAISAPPFFTAALPRGVELDGELFLGRGRFQQCVSITRQRNAGAAWRQVSFVVFDAPSAGGAFSARLAAAGAALDAGAAAAGAGGAGAGAGAGGGGVERFAVLHPHTVCTGPEHLTAELARIEGLGGEGVMLRKADALFRGGRSADLLKVKTFCDNEALVIGHDEGAGRLAGRVGALVCRLRSGKVFKVGTGLTDAERAFDTAPALGSVITFKYFQLTDDAIPRFPAFLRVRPDVDASEFA